MTAICELPSNLPIRRGALLRPRIGNRRICSFDRLPNVRAFMHGPKWRRHFEVREELIATLDPIAAKYHRAGKKILVFTFEADVRELVLDEIRPGVVAQWSDPREWLLR